MTKYTKIFKCITEGDTNKLAQALSLIAKKGDIFALYGTLGAGKSTFSRFFIQSLCCVEDVPSPTFTLVQSYPTDNFEICHYDMYRLENPTEAYELGIEYFFYSCVNLIEWPEKIESLLPKDIWKINIKIESDCRFFEISVFNQEKEQRLKALTYA